MHFSALLAAGELIGMASAAYSLVDDFSGNNFFDVFHFETEDDPTHGFVNYLSGSDAQDAKLWDVTDGVVNMRADSINVVTSSRGRNSVRVSTSKTYQHALVVLDLAHMPANACGIWPAFWMVGTSAWPTDGEIDIIEGVNHQSRNKISVHATNGCFSAGESCLVNKGCDINAEDSFLFGDSFNNVGGGIYAIDWTFEHVNIWFWPRSKAPYDVTGVNPNPSAWSTPTVTYQQDQGCIIDDHFRNMRLIFDITFCGDWAGQPSIFNADGQCSGTCQDFVQNNPQAYKDAYWSINALKVYTLHDAAAASQCPPTKPTTVLTTTVTVTGAPTAQQYLQPLVEVMTDGHWAVGYSVGPPKERRQLDSLSASPKSL